MEPGRAEERGKEIVLRANRIRSSVTRGGKDEFGHLYCRVLKKNIWKARENYEKAAWKIDSLGENTEPLRSISDPERGREETKHGRAREAGVVEPRMNGEKR